MKLTPSYALGVTAALAAILIWAVFLLSTRFAVSGKFSVEEVMLLRLVTASVVTLPLMIKLGITLRGQSFFGTIMLALGPSAIAPYIISSGLFFASAAESGALAPGTLPFWAALFSFMIIGEKPTKSRMFGLLIIFLGALLIGFWQTINGSDQETWKGHLLFLLGASLWSIYSIYFKKSGLSPSHGLVISLFWGTLVLVPCLLLTGKISFHNVSMAEIISVGVVQGILIAVLAMLLYSFAVRCLGAAQTASFGALTPILALVGGAFLLGETISSTVSFGVFVVATGVLLASGYFEKRNVGL